MSAVLVAPCKHHTTHLLCEFMFCCHHGVHMSLAIPVPGASWGYIHLACQCNSPTTATHPLCAGALQAGRGPSDALVSEALVSEAPCSRR